MGAVAGASPRARPRGSATPTRTAEDEIHVADERPDDVVRGELARSSARRPCRRSPRRSSSRRRGRSRARRPCRAGTCTPQRGTGTATRPTSASSSGRSRRTSACARLRKGAGDRAHAPASCAKTSSITSSIGGSSTLRSRTSCSASSLAVTRAVSAFGTRRVTTVAVAMDHLAVAPRGRRRRSPVPPRPSSRRRRCPRGRRGRRRRGCGRGG